MAIDPATQDHKAWLGYLQPDGLVVSPAALVAAGVYLDRNTLALQERFVEALGPQREGEPAVIRDFLAFAALFLQWPGDYVHAAGAASPVPGELCVPLVEYGETLAPDFALRDPRPRDAAKPWILLGQSLPIGADFDKPVAVEGRGWEVSPARRFERLLRETQVPIGLLVNGLAVRLIYAPRGENPGSLTFRVADMAATAGRPILAAFNLLLAKARLFTVPTGEQLPALLAKSREFQSTVSTQLADQVLEALYELLRGFQAAHEQSRGQLLREVLERAPNEIYNGLLTVLLRLVFLLFAEDRGVMPTSGLYVRNYSVHSLFEKLRADAERYPDTMDHRYGAWPRLLVLFRLVHGGSKFADLKSPARSGYLFDPRRYPFLEGQGEPPLVADGVIYRVLERLLMLDGERLSYRTLDVEQIGSVYETMMGFKLEVAAGPSIALRVKKPHGAPVVVNLQALLTVKPGERAKWLGAHDVEVTGKVLEAVKSASSIADLLAALDRKIARGATPHLLQAGSLALQPTDERRRSGSHYTPRSLTEPIVRKALEPIWARLGSDPKPEQILELKICDPAVGSGAFLVEACRQLAEALVSAWRRHDAMPVIPADEDELLYARRVVAQRCLYGVDRNPMAADLAKLSLWLATLAADHPFTFLDHSIRAGDSLVGLTRRQIADFHWKETPTRTLGQGVIEKRIQSATAVRKEILEAGDTISPLLKRQKLDDADTALKLVRDAGDLVVAAFFNGAKDKERETLRDEYLQLFTTALEPKNIGKYPDQLLRELRTEPFPITPFHWEIEFPEVFAREAPGFDVFVGNPPFLGGTMISTANGVEYRSWLYSSYADSGDRMDLCAYFIRRAFDLVEPTGAVGLITTNTIAQGDTRRGGLRVVCNNGGNIYAATRRCKWPGEAAVIVSVVHFSKAPIAPRLLDGLQVEAISAFLVGKGGHNDPARLPQKVPSFEGVKPYGQGFLFDDEDPSATPLSDLSELLIAAPHNREVVGPYISGEEINADAVLKENRFIINFGTRSLDSCGQYPELLEIVRSKVKPLRESKSKEVSSRPWWLFFRVREEMQNAIQRDGYYGLSRVSQHLALRHIEPAFIPSEAVVVFPTKNRSFFASLQSRPHEIWARFFGSSMKDDLRYTPSDCFETFPFPPGFETNTQLETAGKAYYDYRAQLMIDNNEGLTKTYNRFHNPEDNSPGILKLRELHAAMDRAVLDAYGWSDIPTDCDFILDYEDEESDGEEATGRRKKKPYRYRWPDPVRDEVLARLLALNAERAEEERLAGLTAQGGTAGGGKPKGAKKGGRKKKPENPSGVLPGV